MHFETFKCYDALLEKNLQGNNYIFFLPSLRTNCPSGPEKFPCSTLEGEKKKNEIIRTNPLSVQNMIAQICIQACKECLEKWK